MTWEGVNFTDNLMTRGKGINLSDVINGWYLREKNMCFKMMKVEQAGEKLHATLNNIERRLEKIKKQGTKILVPSAGIWKFDLVWSFWFCSTKKRPIQAKKKQKQGKKNIIFMEEKIKL